MTNVVSFRPEGDRSIDFDFLVDLLVTHHGLERRAAEIEAWRECRRGNFKAVRSKGLALTSGDDAGGAR